MKIKDRDHFDGLVARLGYQAALDAMHAVCISYAQHNGLAWS